MRMTPGNLDVFYPVTGEEKEPEMLTVASYRECLQRVCINDQQIYSLNIKTMKFV